MFKYYNPHLVKKHRSYNIEQICTIFKDKKLHPQTVREWVKAGKLEVISKKPIFIYGEVLKDFLKKRNAEHKKHLEFNQFKCVRCQEIVLPENNMISLYTNMNGSIKAAAICPLCGHEIMRFYKKKEQEKLVEVFIVKEAKVTSLYNSSTAASKTNYESTATYSQGEPSLKDKMLPSDTDDKTNLQPIQLSLFEAL